MKNKPKGILYKTTTIPSLIFLLITFLIPILGYVFYKHTYTLTLHEQIIEDAVVTKQKEIEKWLLSAKKEAENIASTNTIVSSLATQTSKTPGTKFIKTKTMDVASHDINKKVSALLEAKLTDPRFSLISVISKEGKIVFSTSQDIVSHSIADTDIYKTLTTKGDKTLIIGMWSDENNQYVIDFISPIKDLEIIGYLHCALNTDELRAILSDKPRHVSSFELVDRQGNILMSSESNTKDKKRYSPHIFDGAEKTQYLYDTFISIKRLKDTDIFIVQKCNALQVLQPFFEIASVYLFTVLFVVIIFIRQSIFLKKKVIRPLSLITSNLKSLSAGIQTASIKGKYPYEIDNLIQELNSFSDAIVKSKASTDTNQTSTDTSTETSVQKPLISHKIHLLNEISSIDKKGLYEAIKTILDDCEGTKSYSDIREALLLWACIVKNYTLLNEIKKDELPESFSIQGLFDEITEEVLTLMSVTNTEAIVEHGEGCKDKQILARKDVLRLVVSLILHQSFINTIERSITVFCNIYDEPKKHLLIVVSDNSTRDKENILLRIAKSICNELGLDLSTESIQNKGTTYYLRIQL